MQLEGVLAIPEDLQARYRAEGLWGADLLRHGLEAQARRAPQRPAVRDAGSTWSYARLEDAVARGVRFLQDRSIGPGTAVLVVAPLQAEAVVAYEAVIRTGALALLLDRRCGRVDVENALAAAPVALVLRPPELADSLGLREAGVPLASFDDLVGSARRTDGWPEPDPAAPAAVVFTSGTTSRPKGVVHSLDTVRAGARNMAEALELTEDDAAFLSTPLASITGLVQMHLTLDRGACLVLEDRFAPAGALARLSTYGVTVLGGAPVIVEELFKEALAQDLRELPLRAISLGGAMIPRSALELGLNRYGITPVRVYGSSEVPVATTTLPSDTGEARLTGDGACARGTEIQIAGEADTGEIWVRGPMRMLGYLASEDNVDAFAEGGWYRTGDLGRFEGGRLTVTGRLKEIVSRKGLKISLGEIDEIAADLPGVEEVAAFGVPDPVTGERLALAVRPVPGHEVTFESVVGWLLDAGLAKWKLPEQVVVWDEPLPRTPSGKVQRRHVEAAASQREALLAPRLRPGAGS